MNIIEAKIRKLSIGDPKLGMTYQVGAKMFGQQYEITEIYLDDDFFLKFNMVRYNIMARNLSSGEVFMWKNVFASSLSQIETYL